MTLRLLGGQRGQPRRRTAIARTGAAIDEIGANYVIVRATPRKRAPSPSSVTRSSKLVSPMDFPPADAAYHNYTEMSDEILAVATAYLTIVRRFSIGLSYEGARCGGQDQRQRRHDEDEPEVLFIGQHHGPASTFTVEMTLYVLHLLANNYGSDQQITTWSTRARFYIIFTTNPDGSEYDIATGSYRSWRKNRQPNSGSSYIGTDLNRNYGYKWGCCAGRPAFRRAIPIAALLPFPHRRRSAFATLLTVASWAASSKSRTSITFHLLCQTRALAVWIHYTDVPSDMTQDDHNVFVTMGQAMAATNGYTPQQASDLYITDGPPTTGPMGCTRYSCTPLRWGARPFIRRARRLRR